MKDFDRPAKPEAGEFDLPGTAAIGESSAQSCKPKQKSKYRCLAINPQAAEFVDKWEASRLTSLSPETLKKYRLNDILIEGIHWVRINSKALRYNAPLLLDWLRNRGNPQSHQKTIEAYLASLPSNQSRRGRRV